jgi:hypothetical protein
MGKLLIDMVYTFHRIYCALARETDLFYIHRVYHHHTLDRRLTFLAQKSLFRSVVSKSNNSISLAVETIARYTDPNVFKRPIQEYPNVWGWRDF